MEEKTLVIMAAGMGSRFGGLKQIEPVDKYGHMLLDFSVYDAILSGFRRVVFIINEEIEVDFKRIISTRLLKWRIKVDYAYQELCVPMGYSIPVGRKKPWGTAHAISCLSGIVNSPFAVINADDFYGRDAFVRIFNFLGQNNGECCMVGYKLRDTLSSSGAVSRGVCQVEQGRLCSIEEHTGIIAAAEGIISNEPDLLSPDTTVSMNFWGLTPDVIEECRSQFSRFLDKNLDTNPLGCEFYLPFVIFNMISESKARVQVLYSSAKWYGVTYKKDKSEVALALESMIESGIYPADL